MQGLILEKRTIPLSYLIDTSLMLVFVAITYFYRSIIGSIGTAILSLIVFIIFYNLYALKIFKTGLHPPLWVFPLIIFVASLVSIYADDIVLLLCYVLLLVIIGLMSSPRTLPEITNPLKNESIYAIVSFMIIVYTTTVQNKLWITLGPFIEFFVATYFLRVIDVFRKTRLLDSLCYRIYGLLIAMLVSLIAYVHPVLILYAFIMNVLKLLMRNNEIVSIYLIADMFNRFILLGGMAWIIDMLLSV